MTYILLSSARHDQQATRSFNQFSSLSQMSQKIIDYFEEWLALKDPVPSMPEDTALEYTSDELFSFMDEFFGELVCLAKNEETQLWIPHTIDWIKEQVYFELRGQTQRQAMQDTTNLMNQKDTTSNDFLMDTY